MCRPPCCNDSGGQGSGIAAVAVIIGAALIAAKIGPIVASIVRTVLDVIRFATLTIGMVMALAVVTWATIALIRWQLRHQALAVTRPRVVSARSWKQTGPADRPDCLACGGTGTVLRAISGSQYQVSECPACEPGRRAG
jgi:hypothetical protein